MKKILALIPLAIVSVLAIMGPASAAYSGNITKKEYATFAEKGTCKWRVEDISSATGVVVANWPRGVLPYDDIVVRYHASTNSGILDIEYYRWSDCYRLQRAFNGGGWQ